MTEPTDEKWRIGTSWGIHVYQGEKGSPGERPVATFHDPADAQRAVDAVNAAIAETGDEFDPATVTLSPPPQPDARRYRLTAGDPA